MAVQGLDRASAPSAEQAKRMLTQIGGRWWNVYIGGPQSGGHGWTPALVADYARRGIDRFMLTYVGRQKGGPLTRAQGQTDGRNALDLARSFGYTGDFPLCLDVELPTFESAPANTVQYAKAWCETVKAAGARPGVYANAAPLKAMAAGGVPADFVWVASWVGHAPSARNPFAIANVPDHLWSNPGQRAWQYAGAFSGKPCRVLGLDVDISVADLGCLAGPPGVPVASVAAAVGRRGTVILPGARGPGVQRLTRRLSFVRSRATHKPYLDGARSHYDTEAVRALKVFQREHGLLDDGKFGELSHRGLASAVAAEKARRRAAHGVTPAAPGQPVPAAEAEVDLAVLVERARVTDRRADAALEALLAYGLTRRRVVQRLQQQQATAPQNLLLQIVELLETIEHEVDELGETIEHGTALPVAGTVSVTPVMATQPAVAAGAQAASVTVTEMEPIPQPLPEGPAAMPPHEPAVVAAGGLATMPVRDLVLLVRERSAELDAARGELIERFQRDDAALATLRPRPRPGGGGTRPPHHGGGHVPAPGGTVSKPGGTIAKPGKPGGAAVVPGKPAPPAGRPKPSGAVAEIRLGDQAHIVRASKFALARLLAAKGNPEHVRLKRALRREARLRKGGAIATQTWVRGVRAAQHLTALPVTGVMDGALQHKLKPYWPPDSAVRRAMRATPGWRLIKGQVSPNFNLREFACKDGTPYVEGLMREQGLTKAQALARARELAKRLERVRKAAGGRRTTLNSVYRTKAHNASVGGKPDSAHLRGYAADIAPQSGVSLAAHRDHVRKAFEKGCGYYPRSNFVHGDFDPRLGQRNWTG